MADDDYIAFAQYILFRFLGHEINEDLLAHALKDFRKEQYEVDT